jgi:hypothetical protein
LSCNIVGVARPVLILRLHRLRRVSLGAFAALGLLASGCAPAHQRASWAIFPLNRQQPHDGLAVVTQPDGYGLHIWIDVDISESGICQPRWRPDAARLFNGNGSAPFSSGLATREEFFQAVARLDVQRALQRESEALCQARAAQRNFRWQAPPQRPEEVKEEPFPLLQEHELLSDPEAIEQQENQLLNPSAAPSAQTNGSTTRQ